MEQTLKQKAVLQRAKVWDRSWKYTQSVETDLRKTFARIRKEQKKEQAA